MTAGYFFSREYVQYIALTRSFFCSPKSAKYRSAAGLRPNPLGELTALPQTSNWVLGREPTSKGEGKDREENGMWNRGGAWEGGIEGKGLEEG